MSRLGCLLMLASAIITTVVVLLLVKLTASALASDSPQPDLQAQLARSRRYARRLERLLGRNELRLRRARRSFRRALRSSPMGTHWLEGAFQCIHHYEGSWDANTGNGYYGGLQMDVEFQRDYGASYLRSFGTANHWPRSVQIAVAIDAWLSRGFAPWPNTRRSCGL